MCTRCFCLVAMTAVSYPASSQDFLCIAWQMECQCEAIAHWRSRLEGGMCRHEGALLAAASPWRPEQAPPGPAAESF